MKPWVQNWLHWLFGLLAGFISGGAGAVTATVTASVIAPDKFNLAGQLKSFLALLGITFLVNGLMGAMLYLKQSPVPKEVLTEDQPPAGGGN